MTAQTDLTEEKDFTLHHDEIHLWAGDQPDLKTALSHSAIGTK